MADSAEDLVLEMRRMNAILQAAFRTQLEREIASVASTSDRQKIWSLIDGKRMTKDIAQLSGIPRRTIDDFLSAAENAGLLLNPRGRPPSRLVDLVPSLWLSNK